MGKVLRALLFSSRKKITNRMAKALHNIEDYELNKQKRLQRMSVR